MSTIFLEPISDLLVDLYFSGGNVYIFRESIVNLIYIKYGLNVWISEKSDMLSLVNRNIYFLFIYECWKLSIIYGNVQSLIWCRTCDLLNIYTIVGTIIVWTLETSDGTSLGLKKIIEIEYWNKSDNLVFLELNMATMWIFFWDPISDLLVNLIISGGNIYIFG